MRPSTPMSPTCTLLGMPPRAMTAECGRPRPLPCPDCCAPRSMRGRFARPRCCARGRAHSGRPRTTQPRSARPNRFAFRQRANVAQASGHDAAGGETGFAETVFTENSPAIYGWVKRHQLKIKSRRDGRTFLSSLTGLGTFPNREPSHKWLGYFQGRRRHAASPPLEPLILFCRFFIFTRQRGHRINMRAIQFPVRLCACAIEAMIFP